MMSIFNTVSFDCSKVVTKSYSTSFTLGIRTLDKKFHNPIFGIYGMVRFADEIVDTMHEFDKRALLTQFKRDTYNAIEQKISLNPILQAFQLTVNTYQIDLDLVESFFKSMEMDLDQTIHDTNTYNEYIYGSAEVVGFMCLKVFCEGDEELYKSLKKYAAALGAAFQKVNFLRDMQSDFVERGRIYFPETDLSTFSESVKYKIETDIQHDFDLAFEGIKLLPKSSQKGVYLAYRFYLLLFKKIKNTQAGQIQKARIRVPDIHKIGLLAYSLVL